MATNSIFDFFIQLHITEKCNLRCKHCYQTGDNPDEMSLPEMIAVITEVSDMIKDWSEAYDIAFMPGFNITGGEPFLRQDLMQILQELQNRKFDVHILSNGILISSERARLLADIGIKGVQISIEGPENIHDAIRGKGSFNSSLKGIGNLLDEGIEVTLNVTLSDINAWYFIDVIELALSIGVHRLGFSRLVPSGKGADLIDSMLKADSVKKIYSEIFSVTVSGLKIVTGDPIASQMRLHTIKNADATINSIPAGGCAAGVSGLTILPDGTITPCRRLPIPIGNARTDSLREVWATSSVLNKLRDKSAYKGKCKKCIRWFQCKGCRAIAYAYSQSKGKGDFLAEDPQCFI